MTITQILLTHGHLDHVGAAAELADHYQVPIYGPDKEDAFWLDGLPAQSRMFGLEECAPLTPTRWLSEGDEMQVGEMTLKVLHCPGIRRATSSLSMSRRVWRWWATCCLTAAWGAATSRAVTIRR